MKTFFVTIMLGFTFFQSHTQVKDAAQNLKIQAVKMASAFMNGNYQVFTNYTCPLVVKSMGGEAKMADVLKKTASNMKMHGMIVSKITFDEPSTIIKSGNEFQSTLAQRTEIKLARGRIVTTSTLIAISNDNGKDWTFIDTSNKDMATLRKALPNLSPSIVIAPTQAPVRYAN
jgi:hypothetical protein